jgi:hypothetical protein
LFPGHVFVGGGWNGREVAARCGRMFSDTVYGFIDVQAQRQLRGELLNLSRTLDADPTLKAIEQLKPGIRARVDRREILEGIVKARLCARRRGRSSSCRSICSGAALSLKSPANFLEPA